MERNKLLELLKNYESGNPSELKVVERFTNFIKTYPDCFHRTQEYGHITGSAWVLDHTKTKALLTHHRKLDKWLQLGGHSDGDHDTLAVATREVKEESGLDDFTPLTCDIFDIDVHLIPARKNEPEHYHFDIRFLFICNGSEEFTISDESHDLKWIKLSEVINYSKDEAVLRLVRKTINLFGE